MGRVPIESIDVHWYLELPDRDMWRRPYAAARRVFDPLLAFSLNVPFALLLPILALLIKLDSKGPVFHVQRRIGENRPRFNLLELPTIPTELQRQRAKLADD